MLFVPPCSSLAGSFRSWERTAGRNPRSHEPRAARAIHRDSGFQRRAAFTGNAVSDLFLCPAQRANSFRGEIQRLRVVANRQNRGKGYSVRHGMMEASGRIVLFTDADLSAPIEEADKLLRARADNE